MQFGVTMFPTDYAIPPHELAREAEARGFESVGFPEQSPRPVCPAWNRKSFRDALGALALMSGTDPGVRLYRGPTT